MAERVVSDLMATIATAQDDGFLLRSIGPADNPSTARLEHPDGRKLVVGKSENSPPLPDPDFFVQHVEPDGFCEGRAGMQYRDLVPGRAGGAAIASHIRIVEGGPVADYVHHHDIDFQMIFCASGWVEVVYQDQGPPFRLHPGDCVLQPPGIRHRVLASSDLMAVVEIASPASHDTHVEHEMQLPTESFDKNRLFGGQHFLRHVASAAGVTPYRSGGWEITDLGIGRASMGAASACIIRPDNRARSETSTTKGVIAIGYLLEGEGLVVGTGRDGTVATHKMHAGSSFAAHTDSTWSFNERSDDLEVLLVEMGCQPTTNPA